MNHALIILAASGLACTIAAANEPAQHATGSLVPTRKAGTLYINMATGERTLTRYLADSTGVAIPEIDALGTAVLFDYWMSIDENPCWDDARGEGFGFLADAPDDIANGLKQPVVGFDFGDMPFDSKITGVVLSTITLATESTDSNNDGVPDTGIDTVAVYYDALSEGNRTSIAPPTAVVRVESIPGVRGNDPSVPFDYDLILDFGGEHFELGDSDGQNLGSMWLPGAAGGWDYSAIIPAETGCTAAHTDCSDSYPNPDADGLADFQYLQYYAKHGSNDKVTQDSTFIGLAVPEGTVSEFIWTFSATDCSYTTPSGHITGTCTTTTTWIYTPDELPAGQSAWESFGIAALGPGGDATNLDWSVMSPQGACCFWFGGLDCTGFLDQLELDPPYNPTWYNFNPYAQLAHGFFSDTPHQSSCTAIDFNADTFLDSGDISAFIQLFLTQDPLTDLNHDSITDNGDIATFINLYLACVN